MSMNDADLNNVGAKSEGSASNFIDFSSSVVQQTR